MDDGSQFFWLYREVKSGTLTAKKKGHLTVHQTIEKIVGMSEEDFVQEVFEPEEE